MRTRGRQCHRVGRALAVAGAQRGHEPVPPHLVGHGRGRPVDLAGYLPAPLPLVQHPLYGLPLVPREPRVRPLRRPLPAPPPLLQHAAPRFRGPASLTPEGQLYPELVNTIRVSLSPGSVAMSLQIYATLIRST